MSAAAMRRRKLKAKRNEKIAERERLATLRGYAERLEAQRVARNTRDAILSDGMPDNFRNSERRVVDISHNGA